MKKHTITAKQIESYSAASFPRTTACGEYWTVTQLAIIDEPDAVQIVHAQDVNVYASEREARGRCAQLMLAGMDGESSLKTVHYVTHKRLEGE